MLTGEQQGGPLSGEIRLQGDDVALQLCLELCVRQLVQEFDGRIQIRGA